MSDRMKMDKNHKELIGRLCSKKIPEVLEQEKKIKVLCDIKQNILGIKGLSEKANISSKELIKLFEECDFEFWKLKDMEEIVAALGLEDDLISSYKHITPEQKIEKYKKINIGTILNINSNKTNMTEILKNVENKLTEEERNEYSKKMGFVIEPKNISDLEKLVTPEEKKFVDRIINELKEKLNGMTDEELEAHLKELGFFQDTMPDNIKERAQINKKIVKVKRISK